jgi:hypothetical protein
VISATALRTALGHCSYAAGCGLATFIAASTIHRAAYSGGDPVGPLLLCTLATAVVWLTGRGIHFALLAPPKDIAGYGLRGPSATVSDNGGVTSVTL